MFNNTPFFLILKDKQGVNSVKRLEITPEAQEHLCRVFTSKASSEFSSTHQMIEFDGRFKVEEGQFMYIDNYPLGPEIKKAITSPNEIDLFDPDNTNLDDIKGVFTGTNEPQPMIAFQKMNKSKLITYTGTSLLLNGSGYEKVDSFGINIGNSVDILFAANRLLFHSFLTARAMFDLNEYYRAATDKELYNFAAHKLIEVQNTNALYSAENWVRKKITQINESKILDLINTTELKETASKYEVDLNLTPENKIVIPEDKKELKNLLRFIDEDFYRGPLTNTLMETSTKKRVINE